MAAPTPITGACLSPCLSANAALPPPIEGWAFGDSAGGGADVAAKVFAARLWFHNLGDFMKTISAFIFLVLFSFPAHAQYKCHGDPVCRANRDGHSVEKARNCTVAKCIKNQATRGYTTAQASNWCPNNLHKGCN